MSRQIRRRETPQDTLNNQQITKSTLIMAVF